MCHANNENRKTIEGTEQPNQEKSERSEKKILSSTWKYWKQKPSSKRRWKKKMKKNTLRERENYLKLNYIAEISSKQ